MAETLGSLIDKLSIVKLKQFHSDDTARLNDLGEQEKLLVNEIDEFICLAAAGEIPVSKLSFKSNKVYKKEGNALPEFTGSISDIISRLADSNCRLWHVQEKVYEFERVPADEKDSVVKQLALINLERTRYIDEIDNQFKRLITDRINRE